MTNFQNNNLVYFAVGYPPAPQHVPTSARAAEELRQNLNGQGMVVCAILDSSDEYLVGPFYSGQGIRHRHTGKLGAGNAGAEGATHWQLN